MTRYILFIRLIPVVLLSFLGHFISAQTIPDCLPNPLRLHFSGYGNGAKYGNPTFNEHLTYYAEGNFDIVASNPQLTSDGLWTWRIDSLHGYFHFVGDAFWSNGSFTDESHWDMTINELTVTSAATGPGMGWVKLNLSTGEIDSLRATWDNLSGSSTDLDGIRWSSREGGRMVPLMNLPPDWSNLEGLCPVGGYLIQPSLIDQTPPVTYCPDVTVSLGEEGFLVIDASNIVIEGTDNCGPVEFYSADPDTVYCEDVGTKWISVWASDRAGNLAHCWVIAKINSPNLPEMDVSTHNRFFDPVNLIKVTPATNGPDQFVKICADGSKKTTQIALSGCVQLPGIHLRVKEDPESQNAGVFGGIEKDENASSDQKQIFWYQHPECWENPGGGSTNVTYKPLHLEVLNEWEEVILTLEVRLFRAPVLMVHGVWADGKNTFQDMQNALAQGNMLQPAYYPGPLTKAVDYSQKNAASFYENRFVVLTTWRNYLYELTHDFGFSVSRFAVVGHSMGGLLTRMFIQSQFNHDDVVKLITVNTPHSGTQAANFLFSKAGIVRSIFDQIGKNTFKGAVRDLQVDSKALWGIDGLNKPENLKKNTVPSHAIITFATVPMNDVVAQVLMTIIGLESNGKPVFEFLTNDIFHQQFHDLIVPINSQTGGLHPPQVSVFDQQWHSSTAHPGVIYRVRELLDKCPNAPEFSQNGFQPEQLTYQYVPPDSPPVTDGSVFIASPMSGSVHAPGEQIQIQVQGAGNIEGIGLAIGNVGQSIFYSYQGNANATFQYTIPSDAHGSLLIRSIGSNPDGASAMDAVTIQINAEKPAFADRTSFSESMTSDFQAKPNPFGQNVVFSYASDNPDSAVEISIYDPIGRLITQIQGMEDQDGIRSFNWTPPAGLPAGLYFARLTIDDVRISTLRLHYNP